MANSYRHPEFFFQVFLADGSGLFGSARLVRYNIEFDDSPAAEIYFAQRSEHCGEVHASPAQLDKTERTLGRLAFRYRFYILDMQEKQAILIFLDSLGGISATLKIMRHVQFQLGEARVRGLQDLIHFLGALSKRTHVVVISERDSQIRCALSNFCDEFAQACI